MDDDNEHIELKVTKKRKRRRKNIKLNNDVKSPPISTSDNDNNNNQERLVDKPKKESTKQKQSVCNDDEYILRLDSTRVSQFIRVFDTITAVVRHDAPIILDKSKGMVIVTLSEDKSALVFVQLSRQYFQHFHLENHTPITLGINLTSFSKLLHGVGAHEVISL